MHHDIIKMMRSKTMDTLNTLRPGQHGRHFADDGLRCISLNENVWILIKISLKFVPGGSINNNPTLFQIMAWRRPGDKPLSETMMVRLLTHCASLGLNELNTRIHRMQSLLSCTIWIFNDRIISRHGNLYCQSYCIRSFPADSEFVVCDLD